MSEKQYYVSDEHGGYAEVFDIEKAKELAKEDSIEQRRAFFVEGEYDSHPTIIFYEGIEYRRVED